MVTRQIIIPTVVGMALFAVLGDLHSILGSSGSNRFYRKIYDFAFTSNIVQKFEWLKGLVDVVLLTIVEFQTKIVLYINLA